MTKFNEIKKLAEAVSRKFAEMNSLIQEWKNTGCHTWEVMARQAVNAFDIAVEKLEKAEKEILSDITFTAISNPEKTIQFKYTRWVKIYLTKDSNGIINGEINYNDGGSNIIFVKNNTIAELIKKVNGAFYYKSEKYRNGLINKLIANI